MIHLNYTSPLPSTLNIELRENFVKDQNGTSMGEVVIFSLHVPLFVFITFFVKLCLLSKFNVNKPITPSIYISVIVYLVEFFTLIIPLVLLFTILSDFVFVILFLTLSIIFSMIIYMVSSPNNNVYYWSIPNCDLFLNRQPFLTYFRALVYLVTAISILGVDFDIFPRRFAKTETYGVSLMDLGVGFFVISNALIIKKSNLLTHGLPKLVLGSSVLLSLGLLRYLLLQTANYQVHVTEYGVHWNFFITLSLVKLLSYVVLKFSRGNSLICGVTLLILHQYMLSSSLETYVLRKEKFRVGFIDANREGIISLTGYLSLYLLGVSITSIVIPTDKKYVVKNRVKTLFLLSVLSALLFLVLTCLDHVDLKVSRRLANLPYVIWVVAISLASLAVTLAVELLTMYFLPIQTNLKMKMCSVLTLAIFESVNYNGLLFFLMANLFTGLVNVYYDTFNSSVLNSVAILLTYMCLNCVSVYKLYLSNIQIKFW